MVEDEATFQHGRVDGSDIVSPRNARGADHNTRAVDAAVLERGFVLNHVAFDLVVEANEVHGREERLGGHGRGLLHHVQEAHAVNGGVGRGVWAPLWDEQSSVHKETVTSGGWGKAAPAHCRRSGESCGARAAGDVCAVCRRVPLYPPAPARR